MSQRHKLIVNSVLIIFAFTLTILAALLYIEFYPRVYINLIDDFEIVDTIELRKGNTLEYIPEYTKEGSRFVDWYVDDMYEVKYDPSTVLDKDIDLFAKFEKIEYTLTLSIDGDTTSFDVESGYFNDQIILPSGGESVYVNGTLTNINGYKRGYSFAGWSYSSVAKEADFAKGSYFKMPAYNVVLYATFTPNQTSVNFYNVLPYDFENPKGNKTAQFYKSVNCYYEGKITQPLVPEISEHTFVGWAFDSSGHNFIDFNNTFIGLDNNLTNASGSEIFSQSASVYGIWTLNNYRLSFDLNIPSGNVLTNSVIISDRTVNKYVDTIMPSGEHLLVTNGISNVPTYKFMGWSYDKTGQGEIFKSNQTMKYLYGENTTMYAIWKLYYTVSFKSVGNIPYAGMEKYVVHNDSFILPELNATQPGMEFVGWAKVRGITSTTQIYKAGNSYCLDKAENLTFYSYFKEKIFTIKYDLKDKILVDQDIDTSESTLEYKGSFKLLPIEYHESQDGYALTQWKLSGNGILPDKFFKGLNPLFNANLDSLDYVNEDSFVFEAVWKKIIEVDFDLNNGQGTAPSAMTCISETTNIKMPSADEFNRRHYIFYGWDTDPDAEVPAYRPGNQYVINEQCTLYAIWTPVEYSVKFYNDGVNNINPTQIAKLNYDILNPLDFSKILTSSLSTIIGYEVAGWAYSSTATTPDFSTTDKLEVNDDTKNSVNLYTVYVVKTNLVRYYIKDVSGSIDEKIISNNANLTFPDNLTLPQGQEIKYWAVYNDEDQEQVVTTATTVCEDLDVYAILQTIVYKIEFNILDPYGDQVIKKTYDVEYLKNLTDKQTEIESYIHEYTGYDFISFIDENDNTLSFGQSVTSNNVYHAEWRAVQITASFHNTDGQLTNDKPWEFDGEYNLLSQADIKYVNSGYQAIGWSTVQDYDYFNGIKNQYVGDLGQQIKNKFITDTNLYVVWIKTYTLTFKTDIPYDSADISLPFTVTIMENTPYDIIQTEIVKYGYIFDKSWYIEGDPAEIYYNLGSNDGDREQISITDDTVLIANLQAMNINVKFNYKDVNTNKTFTYSSANYTFDQSLTIVGDLSTFSNFDVASGKFIDSNGNYYRVGNWKFNGNSYNFDDEYVIDYDGDIVFDLQIDREYILSYDGNGASVFATQQFIVLADQEFTVISDTPQVYGFDFIGWNIKPNADTQQFESNQTYTFDVDTLGVFLSNVTLFAIYTPQQINVVFEANYTDGINYTTTADFGSEIVLPTNVQANFNNQSYRLINWTNDGNNYNIGSSYKITSDQTITFTANWQKEYTVQYSDGKGHTNNSNIKLIVGQDYIVEANIFDVEGFKFSHFEYNSVSYDVGDSFVLTDENVPAGDIVVFECQWAVVKLTITISYIDPTGSASPVEVTSQIDYNTAFKLPNNIDSYTYEGYKFVHFSASTGLNYGLNATVNNIKTDMTFTSVYGKQFTLEYQDQSGNSLESIIKVQNDKVTSFKSTLANLESGQVLIGWTDGSKFYTSTESNYATKKGYLDNLVITQNVILTPVVVNYINVVIYDNDVIKITISNLLPFDNVNLGDYVENVNKENFTLTGYSKTNSNNIDYGAYGSLVIAENQQTDMSLYAVYQGKQITIKFVTITDLEESNGADEDNIKYYTNKNIAAGTTVDVPNINHNKTNYEFKNWYYYNQDDNYVEFDFDTIIDGPITIYAEYNKVYNVIINLKNDEEYQGDTNTYQLTEGQSFDLKTTLKDGYELTGYNFTISSPSNIATSFVSGLGTHHLGSSDMPVDSVGTLVYNLYLVPVFEEKSYTLTINNIDSEKFELYANGVLINQSQDFDVNYNQQIIITNDSVTFDDVNNQKYVITNVNLISGYATAGYKMNDDGQEITDQTIFMPSTDMKLTNFYIANDVNINASVKESVGGKITNKTGQMENGGLSYTLIIKAGQTAELIAIPDTGYVFINWTYQNGDEISTDVNLSISNVENDMTIFAVFALDDFHIEFNLSSVQTGDTNIGGHVTYNSVVYDQAQFEIGPIDFNDTLTFAVNLDSNYEISRIYKVYTMNSSQISTDIAYSNTNNISVKIDKQYQIYIEFKYIEYSVTYLNYDNNTYHNEKVTYNECVSSLPSVSRQTSTSPLYGYDFKGWYLDTTYQNEFTTSTPITAKTVVYGKFEKVYYITFNASGGSGSLPTNNWYSSSEDILNLNNQPTKTNNVFSHWSLTVNSNEYIIAKDKTQISLDDLNVDLSNLSANTFTLNIVAKYVKTYNAYYYQGTNNGQGSQITSATQNNLNIGDNIVFPTSVQNLGYTLSGWEYFYGTYTQSGRGTTLDKNSQYNVGDPNIVINQTDSNHTLTFVAIWEEQSYTLTISNTDSRGYLTRDGQQNNTMTFDVKYNTLLKVQNGKLNEMSFTDANGDNIKIIAVANDGYEFLAWSQDNVNKIQNQFMINMPSSDFTIYSLFSNGSVNVQIKVNDSSAGNIIVESNTYGNYNTNVITNQESLTFSYQAKTGYQFVDWSYVGVDDTKITTNGQSVTIESFSQQAIITANFEKISYALDINIILPTGGITPTGNLHIVNGVNVQDVTITDQLTAASYEYKSSVTITIVLNDSTYLFKEAKVNGASQAVNSENPVMTFTITGNTDIDIEFKYDSLSVTYLSKDKTTIIHTESVEYNSLVNPGDYTISQNDSEIRYNNPYSGYTFLHWYTDENCTILFTSPITVTQNVFLYSKWEKLFKVTFDKQELYLNYEDNFSLDSINLEKDGYTLVGFKNTNSSANDINSVTGNYTIRDISLGELQTNDVFELTYQPIWEIEQYTFDLYVNNSEAGSISTLQYNGSEWVEYIGDSINLQYGDKLSHITNGAENYILVKSMSGDQKYQIYATANDSFTFNQFTTTFKSSTSIITSTEIQITDLSNSVLNAINIEFGQGLALVTYKIKADYVDDTNIASISWTAKGDAYVEYAGKIYKNTAHTITLSGNDVTSTFEIKTYIPRENTITDSVQFTFVSAASYYISKFDTMILEQDDSGSQQQSSQLQNVLGSTDFEINFKLKSYNLKVNKNNSNASSVNVSYYLPVIEDGFITSFEQQLNDANYANNSTFDITLYHGQSAYLSTVCQSGFILSSTKLNGTPVVSTYNENTNSYNYNINNVSANNIIEYTYNEKLTTYTFMLTDITGNLESVEIGVINENFGVDITDKVNELLPDESYLDLYGYTHYMVNGWNIPDDIKQNNAIIMGVNDLKISLNLFDSYRVVIDTNVGVLDGEITFQSDDKSQGQNFYVIDNLTNRIEIKVQEGTTLPAISAAQGGSKGYYFTQFNLDDGLYTNNSSFEINQAITSDMNFQAQFAPNKYNIEFVVMDKLNNVITIQTLNTTQGINYASILSDATNLLTTDMMAYTHPDQDLNNVYTFIGWSETYNSIPLNSVDILSGVYTTNGVPPVNGATLTLYAYFSVQQRVSVTIYDYNNVASVVYYDIDENVNINVPQQIEGKSFAYYSTKQTDNGKTLLSATDVELFQVKLEYLAQGYRVVRNDCQTTIFTIKKDYVLYAIYVDNHTVSYDYNGGVDSDNNKTREVEVFDLTKLSLNNIPYKMHFEFSHWKVDGVRYESSDNVIVTGDTNIVAEYILTSYTLTVKIDHSKFTDSDTQTYELIGYVQANTNLNDISTYTDASGNYSLMQRYVSGSDWSTATSYNSHFNIDGHNFLGYYVGDTLYDYNTFRTFEMPNSDLTIEMHFVPKTVTFVVNYERIQPDFSTTYSMTYSQVKEDYTVEQITSTCVFGLIYDVAYGYEISIVIDKPSYHKFVSANLETSASQSQISNSSNTNDVVKFNEIYLTVDSSLVVAFEIDGSTINILQHTTGRTTDREIGGYIKRLSDNELKTTFKDQMVLYGTHIYYTMQNGSYMLDLSNEIYQITPHEGFKITKIVYGAQNVTTSSTSITVYSTNVHDIVIYYERYFNVTIDANGGTTSLPTKQTMEFGAELTLNSSDFSRANYTFAGIHNGSTIDDCNPSVTYTFDENQLNVNLIYRAQWNAVMKTMTFDANGGSGSMTAIVQQINSIVILPACDFTFDNHIFAGWKIGTNTYQESANYTLVTDVTAIAQWEKVTVNVQYVVSSQDVTNGNPASAKLYGNPISTKANSYTVQDMGRTNASGSAIIVNNYDFIGLIWNDNYYAIGDTIDFTTSSTVLTPGMTVEVQPILQNTYDGDYYYNDGLDYYTINSYTGNASNLTIGSQVFNIDLIGYRQFKYIDNEVFKNNDVLTNITLPNCLTALGYGVFEKCISLTSIVIPDAVTDINDYAFSGCTSLESIELPDSLTDIRDYAFTSCKSLTSIVLPDNLTTIGVSAFEGCLLMQSIDVSENLTEIKESAFYSCESLTNIVLPDTVSQIGQAAFAYCTLLESVNIPSQVTELVEDTFYNCQSLTNVDVQGDLISIGNYAFASCISLEDFEIRDSVISIGESAFSNCEVLTTIDIANSVETIGVEAFYGCESLTSVTLPVNLTIIEDGLFKGCEKLEEILITSNNITIIGESAFKDCQALTYVGMSDNLTDIKDSAFEGCMALESITLPSGLEKIYSYAFKDCRLLESIDIPDGVQVINEGTFQYCVNLISVNIPDSVTSIKGSAFDTCVDLTSMIIPDSVTEIHEYAFNYCVKLNLYMIHTSQDELILEEHWNDDVNNTYFYSESCKIDHWHNDDNGDIEVWNDVMVTINYVVTNDDLTNLNAPGSAKSYGTEQVMICNYTISDNSNITLNDFDYVGLLINNQYFGIGETINLGDVFDSVTKGMKVDATPIFQTNFKGTWIEISSGFEIESYSGNDVSLNIPYKTFSTTSLIYRYFTSIGDNAFKDESVNTVYLTSNITSIGDNAFKDSSLKIINLSSYVTSIGDGAFAGSNIQSVTIPNTITVISDSLFEGCTSLSSVTLHDGVTKIGENAFKNCIDLDQVIIQKEVTKIGMHAFIGCESVSLYMEHEDSSEFTYGYAWNYKCGHTYYYSTTAKIDTWYWDVENNIVLWNDVNIVVRYKVPDNISKCPADSGVYKTDSTKLCYDYYISSSLDYVVDEYKYIGVKVDGLDVYGKYYAKSTKINFLTLFSFDSDDVEHNVCGVEVEPIFQTTLNATFSSAVNGEDYTNRYATLDSYNGSETTVTLPNVVYSIDDLQYMYLEVIGNRVFFENSTINYINLNNKLRSIGDRAFYGSGLKKLTLNSNMMYIDQEAFYYCDSLESVDLGHNYSIYSNLSKLTTIGQRAFYDCQLLEEIIVPDTVTSVGNEAFFKLSDSLTVFFESTTLPATSETMVGSGVAICRTYSAKKALGDWRYVNGKPDPWGLFD